MAVSSTHSSTLVFGLVDNVSKPARTVAQALKDAEVRVKDLAKAMEGTGVSDRLQKSLSQLKLSKGDIETVANAWKDYARAANLAADSTQWTKQQASDVKNWETRTIKSLREVRREQEAFAKAEAQAMRRAPTPSPPAVNWRAGAAAAGVYGAYKAQQFASNGLSAYREYSDVNAIMKPVLSLTPEQQALLKQQQQQEGIASRYSPVKVAEAQKKLGERGIPFDFIRPYTHEVINYASAMNIDLPQAVQTLEANLFSTGKLKGVKTQDEAGRVIRRVADFSTHLAKISGMSDEDISGFYEYGGLAGKQAGLSDETVGAMAALMKRNQISGEKAGVAMRSISAHLLSPTREGLDAMAAAGIDYDKFTKQPGGLSADNLGTAIERHFGRKLTPEQLAAIQEKMRDEDVVTSREAFTSEISSIIGSTFQTKKGKPDANSAKQIAKVVGAFYQNSLAGIDTEGLIKAIAASGVGLGILNKIFGFQQGSRAGAALENPEDLEAYRKKLAETPEGYAEQIAEERLKSFDGAVKQLEGSIETLQIKIASAFDGGGGGGGLTAFVNGLTMATNWLTRLSTPIQQIGTVAAATATAFLGLKSIGFLTSGFKLTASASALTGSAAQLSGAANALEIAAARLGGGHSLPGGAPAPITKSLLGGPKAPLAMGVVPAIGAAGGLAFLGLGAGAIGTGIGYGVMKGLVYVGAVKPTPEDHGAGWQRAHQAEQDKRADQAERERQRKRGVVRATRHPELFRPESPMPAATGAVKADSSQVAPKVDTSQIDGVAPHAAAAVDALAPLNGTWAPKVDSSQIAATVAAVEQLLDMLGRVSVVAARMHADAVNASHGLQPIGKTPGGHFALSGIHGG